MKINHEVEKTFGELMVQNGYAEDVKVSTKTKKTKNEK